MTRLTRGMTLLIALTLLLTAPAAALEQVTLQLRWKHQFQFAGYYLAKAKGYYRDEGLEVTILENGPGQPGPLTKVVNKEVEFGITASGVVVEYANGAPVVVLAAIFQHSPVTWLVRGDRGIESLHDLAGKRLMTLLPVMESVELLAPFLVEGMTLEQLELVPTSFDIQDLVDGRVDAFNAYLSNEPFLLERRGIPFKLIQPRTYGVDFYGDVLFTHAELARRNPELVRRFRRASLRGWRDTMADIEGTAAFIHANYATDKSLEHLIFEGRQLKSLVLDDIVPIGHMNPGRWRRIAEVNASLKLMPADVELAGFIYDPNPQQDLSNYYLVAGLLSLALLISLSVMTVIATLNRRLRLEIAKRRAKELELERLARTDPLTDLMNRRAFLEAGDREFALSLRQKHPLSLIMVDLDHFKDINDNHGHPAGDRVLQQVADLLREHVRESDACGRLGGEEFALLLPETASSAALHLAQRLRQALAETPMTLEDGRQLKVTMSLGVVERLPGERCFGALLSRADNHLYRAKALGRDQVVSTGPC
ncbi:diguanylate cyclase [Gallaecimonas sp. GXIMD4217]|uniref:diguanylate cyclase n=1 Tax=Gallaecimonas sp. GXIMD4217 TaxID=3131927 RepID=UPI00311B0D5D